MGVRDVEKLGTELMEIEKDSRGMLDICGVQSYALSRCPFVVIPIPHW